MEYPIVGKLAEGTPIVLLWNAAARIYNYDWFEISSDDLRGFH